MATYIKGNIQYAPVVEQINRKFAVKSKKCSMPVKVGPVTTEANSWMGGATRSGFRGGLGTVSKNYFVYRENSRATLPSTNELLKRAMFQKAVSGRNHIVKDLSQVTSVQIKYREACEDLTKEMNGVSARGYTLLGWVMAVQYAGLKAAEEGGTTYNENQFPANFDA